MTERPDDTPDFLRKPSDESAPPTSPSYGQEPTSPYVTPEQPTAPYPAQGGPGYGPPPPVPGGYAPYGAPGAPGWMPGYPFAQAHSGANISMGLGITSLVCSLGTFVCCVTLPGALTGPFAIALAVRARKEMQQNPGLYNNEGAATTGLVTGIIGTVLGLVMIGLVVFVFGFIFSVDDY